MDQTMQLFQNYLEIFRIALQVHNLKQAFKNHMCISSETYLYYELNYVLENIFQNNVFRKKNIETVLIVIKTCIFHHKKVSHIHCGYSTEFVHFITPQVNSSFICLCKTRGLVYHTTQEEGLIQSHYSTYN